ncbi:MAG: PQQ-binding-like beta-propeller repeat protein [Phycisphaerae bacterium]
MRHRHSRLPVRIIAASLVALPPIASLAQQPVPPPPDLRNATVATLPESNEALLITGRVNQALRDGDYQLAAQLITTIMKLPPDLVASPASRTYYPVWRQALRLLLQFPPAGVEVYRQLYDAEVRSRFEEARDKHELAALDELFRNYPLCSVWEEIGHELATHMLDDGKYADAIQILRELQSSLEETRPEVRGLLVAALVSGGGRRTAIAVLDELAADAGLAALPGWPDKIKTLREWVQQRADATAEVPPLRPVLTAASFWNTSLAADAGPGDDDALIAEIDAARRLPLLEPVLIGDRLIARARGSIWCLEATTLSLLWQVEELNFDDVLGSRQIPDLNFEREDGEPTGDVDLQLTHHLRHVVSAADGLVFTIESLALADSDLTPLHRRGFMFDADLVRRNELVARSLNTGQILWRTGEETSSVLFDVSFQDAPQMVGDQLVAPLRRDGDLRLAILEPSSGKLIREVAVVGPPTHSTNAGGRFLLAQDETTLYACTGNGVIAALDRRNFSWLWASTYNSSLAGHLGQMGWTPTDLPPESSVDRPVFAGELLIVAPMDSTEILAFDRFSGREVWRIPRREYFYLIGATEDGLIVGGNTIACLSLAAPQRKLPLWRSVPLEVIGRPALVGDRLFAATKEGVVALSARNGRVLDGGPPRLDLTVAAATERPSDAPASTTDVAQSSRGNPANVLASTDAIFLVSATRVTKLPDPHAARKQAETTLAATPGDRRAALILAWLDVLDGKLLEAAARLETIESRDDSISRARDRLLTDTFIELARNAGGGDRLAKLKQAASLAHSPEVAARLALIIGRALEEDRDWSAALDHYLTVLSQTESRLLDAPDDVGVRTADWLHATRRMRVALDSMTPVQRAAWMQAALAKAEDPQSPVTPLVRLAAAFENPQAEPGIGVALAARRTTRREIAPEVLRDYLPDQLPPGATDLQRRNLLLARWEVAATISDTEGATGAARDWQQTFANKPLSDSEAAARESMRIDSIESAQRKTSEFAGETFGEDFAQFGRRWRVRSAELLLDPDRPLAASDGWFMSVLIAERRVQLREILRNQQPQRDRVWGVGAARSIEPTRGINVQSVLRQLEARRRDVWWMRTYEQRAVVPVPGGMVCLGMGPALYGGNTIWEQTIAGMDEPPREFADQSAVGRFGVYVRTRRDRVTLFNWFDGQVCWQRDFPGATINQIALVGNRLVLLTDEQQLWTIDARHGDNLQRLPSETGAVVAIDTTRDDLIVWTDANVTLLDIATLRPRWVKACRGVQGRQLVTPPDGAAIEKSTMLVYRERERLSWDVLRISDGATLIDGILDLPGYLTAAAALPDGRLLLAGKTVGDGERGGVENVHVVSIDVNDPAQRWARDVPSSTTLSAGQLLGHPNFVPVLKDRGVGDAIPAVVLVDKRDGRVLDPLPLRGEFESNLEFMCEPIVLVTPSRIVIQLHGNLLAFGTPPVSKP